MYVLTQEERNCENAIDVLPVSLLVTLNSINLLAKCLYIEGFQNRLLDLSSSRLAFYIVPALSFQRQLSYSTDVNSISADLKQVA